MADREVIGITGGRGVLGSGIASQAKELGLKVIHFPGDITSPSDIRTWLAKGTFDAVLHLAALVPVSAVEADPEHALKIRGWKVNGTT